MNLIFSFQKNNLGFPVYVIYKESKYELQYDENLHWQEIIHSDLKNDSIYMAIKIKPKFDPLKIRFIQMETLEWIKRWNKPNELRKDFPRQSFVYSFGSNNLPSKVLIGNRWHQLDYYEITPILIRHQLKVGHIYRGFRVYPRVNYRCMMDIVRYIRAWNRNLTRIYEGRIDK